MTEERDIEVKYWINCPLLRETKEVSVKTCEVCRYAEEIDFVRLKVRCSYREKEGSDV